MTTFSTLGLSPTLLATLEKQGYTKPTPIQAQAIPLLLKGRDLLGIAQTGTGKTAAFALPILQHILTNRIMPAPKSVRALILSPTRELASQIAESFNTYARGLGLKVATIYGGVKYGPQYKALNGGLDILVATPGRLIDHIEQKTVDLRGVECFVLDEADQMLDLGFVKPIRQVAAKLPHKRQNLFFSATMPREIAGLAAELLTDPARVEITPEATTAEKVSQQVIFIEAQRKRALLSELYADEAFARTLVFTRTKRSADRVAAYLQAGGIESAAIHGDKNQSQRERALQAFRAGKLRALVATDIAARGIDVDNVSHVLNFELPNVAEAYVHRIGRTARAGKSGISITLCADDERKLLKDIERVTRQRIPAFDRRKDLALKLLDEAILASGQTEKPKTPDRLPEHDKSPKKRADGARGGRHSDPDAEFVHKRSRNRTGSGARNGAERGDRAPRTEQRPERYDPMAAERPAAPAGAKPFKPRGDRPAFGGKRPPHSGERPAYAGDRPARSDRPAHTGDRPAHAGERPAHSGERRPHDDARGPKRPFSKPGAKGGYKGAGGGFKGPKPAFMDKRPAEGEAVNRSEGAQFKRRRKG
ncbi:MAG: DEAD/DEAH box helicase [Asticcacaulis sp.]|nr:DEAD/DEAH box helicase [Asticcacaulis sp.]